MMIIEFIFSNLKTLGAGLFALIMVFLVKRSESLSKKNQELNLSSKEKDKVINIQAKVLDVSEKIKPTNLDVILDRLSNKTK